MTKQELKEVSRAFPQLFAYNSNASAYDVGSNEGSYTFNAGIPPMFSSRTGKKVVRADVNGLGRLVSKGGFFNATGGYHTFSREVSDFIGGYPYGAILRYRDSETGYVRTVRSLIPDNSFDFVETPSYIDNEHWGYVDAVVPTGFRPRIFQDWANSKSGIIAAGANPIVAEVDMLVFIQSGPPTGNDTSGDNDPAYFWVDVCKSDKEEYSTAGMLAYIPPVSSAYTMLSQSTKLNDQELGSKAVYTAFYSSSPVQVYLHAGDKFKISSNRDYKYSSKYVAVPLKA